MSTEKKRIVPNTVQRDRYDIAVSGESVNGKELEDLISGYVNEKYPYGFECHKVDGGFNITVLQKAGIPSFKLLDAVRDVSAIICKKCGVEGAPIHKSHWVKNRAANEAQQIEREKRKQMSWLVSSCAEDGLFKKFTPRQTDYDMETSARNDNV